MNKFTLLVFVASLLFVGCTASKHLMNAPEPSPEEKEIQRKEVQQILKVWHGRHISTAIQKWGIPHGISNTDTGSKIYIWQTPSLTFLQQAHREIISSRQSVNLGRRVTQTPDTTIKMYQLIFHTDPKGIIYKISANRDLNPSAGSRSSHFSQ
ncbi:hypothetical protein J5I95_15530 [Candidatus Poribacteria bacterium]|jgi:hypothetical protein|nr:hypothetical protein [Candidatus Poribacteria bacterium]